MKGKLIIFSAPSGSGKTTIVRQIMQTEIPFEFSISATSRSPRNSEADGIDYYFFSPENFKKGINNGDFLEWEEVYENQFYGTLKSEVERIRNIGHHVVFDVDVIGGLNIKKIFGKDALSIFIKPPSLKTLEERLINRETENPESLKKRLDKAEYEMTFSDKFDKIIINDKLDEAISQTLQTIKSFLAE